MTSSRRLAEALRVARNDDSGLVLAHLDPADVPRLLGALALRIERDQLSPGQRYRRLLELAERGR